MVHSRRWVGLSCMSRYGMLRGQWRAKGANRAARYRPHGEPGHSYDGFPPSLSAGGAPST